ncbi:MAG: ECF transporter S component [Bacillota bacterium]|jgi:energy-coupling factor transport system substrate-specific component
MAAEKKEGKKGFFKAFTTGEIVILAVVGIVFGVGGTPMVFLGRFFMTALGTYGWIGFALILGWFYLAGVLGGYIVRKPGASTLGEVISGVAQVLTGNPNGVIVLITTFLQGFGADAAYAIFGYKKWGPFQVALAGVFSSFLGTWIDAYFFGMLEISLWFNIIAWVVRAISGAVFGLVGMVIFNAVAKAGVLRGTMLDKEVRG